MMKFKKSKVAWMLPLLMVLYLCFPVFIEGKSLASNEFIGIKSNYDMISLTDVREIMIEVDFGYKPDLSKLEWSLGDKLFSEWREFSAESGKFDGKKLISFTKAPYLDGNTVKATIRFDIAYDMSSSSSTWGFTYAYWDLVGRQTLSVKDTANGKTVNTMIEVRVYDRYHTYDEIKPAIDKIMQNAKPGRYVEYMSNGKSVEGRDLHFVILAKDKESVQKYLNETKPQMLENPEALQQKLKNNTTGDYKIPIYFSNIHPNEVPATDALLEILESFAMEENVSYNLHEFAHIPPQGNQPGKHIIDQNEPMKRVELDVDEILDDVIILLNFTTNPDGRYHNVRVNANGFDLNRDCSFQTQPESRYVISVLAKWRPTIFLEYHGFYKECVIAPPTTAPHDPNVEYDLILPNNVELAQAMGIAGISNSSYEEYQIPYLDLSGGWDDLAPNYTDYYVQSLGSVGSIIEIPDPNEASVDLLKYASYAAIDYLATNKDRLFANQLEIYRRGIYGLDEKEKVDPFFVDESNVQIGRPRGYNKSFFPEYYVIPIDKNLQKNALEAHRMAERLMRSGVHVDGLSETVKVGNINFNAGSYVVNMHQATRAIANNYLYDGLDVSSYEGIYSENVISMHNTLGFDRYEIRDAGVFDGKLERVDEVMIPKTDLTDIKDSKTYVIRNTNNDAIKAVNKLLDEGKEVQMLTDSIQGAKPGDFVVSKEDLNLVKDHYLLDVDVHNGKAHKVTLEKPIVTAIASGARGDGSLEFVLRELGFHVTEDMGASNIIVSQGATDVSGDILRGKSYVGIGRQAMSFMKNSGLLPEFDYITPTRSSAEALVKASIAQDSSITGFYDKDESIYIVRGGYITGVPKGAKVLTTVSKDDNFFISGYWQDNDELKGQDLSFNTNIGKAKVTLFANDIAFRAVIQSDWRMLANSIFTAVSQ